jgi:hypothetical protein
MIEAIAALVRRMLGIGPLRSSTVSQFLNAERRHHGAL